MEETAGVRQIGLRIIGRVQGVGFRWWTARVAEELGLSGTVRNCVDGSVEIHAAGRADALERLRVRLIQGPPMARVDRLEPIPSTDPLPPRFRIVG